MVWKGPAPDADVDAVRLASTSQQMEEAASAEEVQDDAVEHGEVFGVEDDGEVPVDIAGADGNSDTRQVVACVQAGDISKVMTAGTVLGCCICGENAASRYAGVILYLFDCL